MLFTIVIFVIVLSLLVFVHEAGHFFTAKKAGMKVEEFGFGFPPKMVGIKRGETIYSINWIPLGGFVKIKGEDGESKTDEDSFAHKKVWQRAIVLSSGVLMNVVLCVVLLSIGFIMGLPQVLGDELEGAMVEDKKIQIVSVLGDSPAAEADILVGDVITNIDGEKFIQIESLQNYIDGKTGEMVRVQFLREGEILTKEIVTEKLEISGKGGIGVGLVETGLVSYPWYAAFWQGLVYTLFWAKAIILAFYNLIKELIVAHEVSIDISGPVGIAVITGQAAKMGFVYIMQFTALLSLNLAIINFLPLPALDGGRVLFLIIEKIRGRAVSQKVEAAIHNIGFALLMLLIIIITFRDVTKFEIIDKLKGLF